MAWVLDPEPKTEPANKEESPETPKEKKWKIDEREYSSLDSAALGASQGVLDVAQSAISPFNLLKTGLESSIDYFTGKPSGSFGKKDDQINIDRENTKLDIINKMREGKSLDLNELMSLTENEETTTRPILQNASRSAEQAQESIPKTGNVQESTRRIVHNLPLALLNPTAAFVSTGSELIGQYAGEGVRAAGGSEKAAGRTDLALSVLPLLFGGLKKAATAAYNATAEKVPAYARKVGSWFAKAEIQGNPNNFAKSIQKLSSEEISNLNNMVENISKDTFSSFPEFDARRATTDILKENANNILSDIHGANLTPKEAWSGVGLFVENQFQKEKKIYDDLFQEARNLGKKVTTVPKSAIKHSEKIIKDLDILKTKSPEHSMVIDRAKTAIQDLGKLTIPPSELKILDASGKLITTPGGVKYNPVTLDKLMELKTRLSNMLNYETIDPSVKNLLKPLVGTINGEILNGFGDKYKYGKKVFEEANTAYGNTANRFGKDVIRKIRTTENPEALSSTFSTPSNIEALKDVVGSEPAVVRAVERQIVSNIAQSSPEAAYQQLKQVAPYLSEEANTAANTLIRSGDKLTDAGQKIMLKSSALADVQEAISNGTRPDYTLKAMKTPEGYQTVKSAFSTTPKGKEVFKVLEKQLVGDMVESVIKKDGSMDWERMASLAKDPHFGKIITDLRGPEGITFIKRLGSYSRNIVKNIEMYELKNPGQLSAMQDAIQKSTPGRVGPKAVMTGLLYATAGKEAAGAYAGFEAVVGGSKLGYQISKKAVYKILSNPKAQAIIEELENPKNWDKKKLQPLLYQLAIESI